MKLAVVPISCLFQLPITDIQNSTDLGRGLPLFTLFTLFTAHPGHIICFAFGVG